MKKSPNRKLVNTPIEMPDHPYMASLKDFGADELLAGFVDIGSTALVSFFVSPALRLYVLPFVGPVIEKFVFFLRHVHEAYRIFSTVPKNRRQEFSFYFKQGLKAGSENLVKDLIFHDPLYIFMMLFGLQYFPLVPPFMLSALSYTIAVLMVAGIDVIQKEIRFNKLKKQLHKLGFESEHYYEARFFMSTQKSPKSVVRMLMKEFKLPDFITNKYDDTYFETSLPTFNGRAPKMRFRSREKKGGANGLINTLQLVYTRAKENKVAIDQVRYFIVEKEKIYLMLKNRLSSINQTEGELKKFLEKAKAPNPYYSRLRFERTLFRNKEMAICVDNVMHKRPFYMVEIKVWKDVKLLQQVMRYLMVECPLASIQTTHGKKDILEKAE